MVVTSSTMLGTKDVKNTFKEFRVLEALERSKKKKQLCVAEYKKNYLNTGKEAHNSNRKDRVRRER